MVELSEGRERGEGWVEKSRYCRTTAGVGFVKEESWHVEDGIEESRWRVESRGMRTGGVVESSKRKLAMTGKTEHGLAETSDDGRMTSWGFQELRAGPGSNLAEVAFGSNCRLASVGKC